MAMKKELSFSIWTRSPLNNTRNIFLMLIM